MESPSDVTGPMNLGNPEEVSIYSLAKTICTLTGSKSPMHYALPQNDDPKQRQPDIALAQQLLEWHPKIGLNEGLQRTITYFSKELHLTNLDPKNQTAFQSKR
jgi:UDP-glucuronate decarboxylase